MSERGAGAPDVTVVVPVYGNGPTLEALLDRIEATLAGAGWTGEVLFVDDGSPDASWQVIEGLARRPGVRGLRLAANQGQGVAVSTAFARARGRVLATIDADLDSFPEDLPALIEAAAEHGFAMGTRSGRRSLVRTVASRAFNARIRMLGHPFHDIGCGSLAVRAELGAQLAELGMEQRTIRYKLALQRLAGGVVERPTRSVPTRRSGYRWRDLAAIWVEVEDEVVGSWPGRLGRRWLAPASVRRPRPEVIADTAGDAGAEAR